MTREEVTTLAHKANINVHTGKSFAEDLYIERLEGFAAVVAAHEREQCAKLAAEPSYLPLPSFDKAPSELMMGRIEGERSMSRRISDAIRARGKA